MTYKLYDPIQILKSVNTRQGYDKKNNHVNPVIPSKKTIHTNEF
jgi:hypothetical protein